MPGALVWCAVCGGQVVSIADSGITCEDFLRVVVTLSAKVEDEVGDVDVRCWCFKIKDTISGGDRDGNGNVLALTRRGETN